MEYRNKKRRDNTGKDLPLQTRVSRFLTIAAYKIWYWTTPKTGEETCLAKSNGAINMLRATKVTQSFNGKNSDILFNGFQEELIQHWGVIPIVGK